MALDLTERGSEWKKWDLHVHTPASLYHRFGPKDEATWENFILDIEQLSPDFVTLGINDYFFLDGYERLKREKEENGRLKNIKLLLPVVEFRIDKFAGVDFGQLKRINLHVIFSEQLSIETIKSQFLNTLEQSYHIESGEPWTRAITPESVEELGRQLKSQIPEGEHHKYGSDIVEGFNNLNVREEKIFESLNKDCFKGKYLIAVGKTEWQELKWTDSSIATKKSIINRADIVFTSASSIENFQKAKSQLQKQAVNHLLLDCSDAHYLSTSNDKDRIGNCFTWVKANETFEGLKQIIYEPEDRVAVQLIRPDDKPGYQVIESIIIDHADHENGIVSLNENLNSIIGGRSTGKSVLLAAIAKKLRAERLAKNNDDYNKYVEDISQNLIIKWKDGEVTDGRDIEYFPQSYMNDLSKDPEKLNALVQDILKQKGKQTFVDSYDQFRNENRIQLQEVVNRIFRLDENINEKLARLKEKGDKKGIEDEIKKLQHEIDKITSSNSLSEEELSRFNNLKAEIARKENEIKVFEADIASVQLLRNKEVVGGPIEYEIASVSDAHRDLIALEFNKLKKEFELVWLQKLEEIVTSIGVKKSNNGSAISALLTDPVYIQGASVFQNNQMFEEYSKKIKIEQGKLQEITALEAEITLLNTQRNKYNSDVFSFHGKYYEKINEVVKDLSISYDGLDVKALPKFMTDRYKSLLQSSINMQSHASQALVNFSYTNDEGYLEHLKQIIEKLFKNELPLKNSYSNESLVQQLLSNNNYSISYGISYDNDSFDHMSEGKRAFVVLKLLLDFSDKNCPILIDQPEDDLDNRAIFKDLVVYLKRKKKARQIIVVTHNPNIVVGADSELIIVANQHGVKCENVSGRKFQYSSGSLEHTKPHRVNKIILEGQGTREHVCEILEGGNDAFRKRENKYALN